MGGGITGPGNEGVFATGCDDLRLALWSPSVQRCLSRGGAGGSSVWFVLLERERELAVLDLLLDGGGAVVIEGGAGIGKTALLEECCRRAGQRGRLVLHGRGSELEQNFAFGVVRQLFERELVSVGAPERAELLAGPAHAARELLIGHFTAAAAYDNTWFAVVHGLYWLTVNIAAHQPVLVVIDDAHWADTASLGWLAYLVGRLEGLAVAVVVALRPAERASSEDALLTIRARGSAVRPMLLSVDAVAAMAQAILDADITDSQCVALRQATGGNPFYLSELLRSEVQRRASGDADADLVHGYASEVVFNYVEARIRRLDRNALELAQALAVLGDGCRLRHASAMIGLDIDSASRLAADLLRVEVLAACDPPRFLHPIVRAAVEASLAIDQRHAAHRAAARELDCDHRAPGQVAAHLLQVHPAGDLWVLRCLRRAARAAMAAGAPKEAGQLLRRALAEPPPPADKVEVLRDLAAADANAGRQTAFEWLDQALTLTEDPRQRAEIAHEVAHTYAALFRWVEAVDVTDRALSELGDRDSTLAARLEAELVVAGMHDARRAHRVAPVIDRLLTRSPSESTTEPLAVARGLASTFTSLLSTKTAPELENVLLSAAPAAQNWDTRAALLWILIIWERFQVVDDTLPAMIEAVHRTGSARGLIATYSSLGLLKYRLGALPEADGAARVALRVLREGDFTAGLGLAALVADIAVEAGELDEAQALVDLIPAGSPGALSVLGPAARGRLSLARGDGQQALDHFESCMSMFSSDLWRMEMRDVGYLHARSGAAQALLLVGQRDRAEVLADSELADARVFGERRALGIALRVAGLARGGAPGLRLLEESVTTLRESPALLERAKSLIELGAALRRAGQRLAARPLLFEALDLAAGCAAPPLAARARVELAAAGGRPRREHRHGVEALTPSELRVARLAADGHTNRQIAQRLYVTPKTVETHLARSYAKLGIMHRGELPDALSGENIRGRTRT